MFFRRMAVFVTADKPRYFLDFIFPRQSFYVRTGSTVLLRLVDQQGIIAHRGYLRQMRYGENLNVFGYFGEFFRDDCGNFTAYACIYLLR